MEVRMVFVITDHDSVSGWVFETVKLFLGVCRGLWVIIDHYEHAPIVSVVSLSGSGSVAKVQTGNQIEEAPNLVLVDRT